MKKLLKWSLIVLLTVIIFVALAGMYKFNYLASQEGYNCDGNKITIPVVKDKSVNSTITQ